MIPLTQEGKPSYHFLDTDGLWGTHWNLNILWSLVYPEYGNTVAETFLSYYRNSGLLARDSWGGNWAHVMVGDQTVPLLVALVNTGRATFDKELAYRGAVKNAFPGGVRDRAGYEEGPNPAGGGIGLYIRHGYVPLEIRNRGGGFHRGGAAMTLEYAYQDWCLAGMAKKLGKPEGEWRQFMQRSGNWKNIYDPTTGPQDVNGLVKAMGGSAAFTNRLEDAFKSAIGTGFAAEHGEHWSARVDYDNQPGCQLAHLFSHAGTPWKTQYWVRQVKEATFSDTTAAVGYRGDEDQGQMGALSVLMAVGLFDLQGLADPNPTLEITSPVFDKIVFHLPGQKKFTIVTTSQRGKDNTYIQSARINGKKWTSFEFPFEVFANGGSM